MPITQTNYATVMLSLLRCQVDVQVISLTSYNSKITFKKVDNHHILYCNSHHLWKHHFPWV